MSGKIQKSQIPVIPLRDLPPEVKTTLIAAKQAARSQAGGLVTFGNKYGRDQYDGSPLPKPQKGCSYREFQVGAAHPDDAKGKAGIRRLVLEVHNENGDVTEAYYSTDHYGKGSFVRIV